MIPGCRRSMTTFPIRGWPNSADDTYKDAEAVLQEATKIQEHLTKQDEQIASILEQIKPLLPKPI